MTSKVRVAEWLGSSPFHQPLGRLVGGLRKRILVLAYHRVLPALDEARYPFDLGLVSATPEEFDWQMSVLRKEFNPIPLSMLGLYLRGRAQLPERPVVVTFDDGYADNFHHAFPIMQRYQIPATVFVVAGHLGTRRMLWHDAAPNIVMRAKQLAVTTPNGDITVQPGDSVQVRRKACARLLTHLKSLPHAENLALVESLVETHRNSLLAEDAERVTLLEWDQARKMVAGGVEIGSHTMTHAMLARLKSDELVRELTLSKQRIEQELQVSCDTIAYPVGRSYAYTAEAIKEVGLAGYRIGAAYDSGVNREGVLNPYELRRQSVERHTTRAYFRSMLSMPQWFH